jgi:hypothetical protein
MGIEGGKLFITLALSMLPLVDTEIRRSFQVVDSARVDNIDKRRRTCVASYRRQSTAGECTAENTVCVDAFEAGRTLCT